MTCPVHPGSADYLPSTSSVESSCSFLVHGTLLSVEFDSQPIAERVKRILAQYSFREDDTVTTKAPLRCRLSTQGSVTVPDSGFDCGTESGVRGIEADGSIYLISEGHTFHLEPSLGRLDGIVPAHAEEFREDVLMYALLALMRLKGSFALHAAAMSRGTLGLLIVGESGCGKSTLAHSLLREGWGYVSDDAVLLRIGREGVEALTLRRALRLVEHRPAAQAQDAHRHTGTKRQIDVVAEYPDQVRDMCKPDLILFPRVANQTESEFASIDRKQALQGLVSQSVSFMLGRSSGASHLEMLVQLLHQSSWWRMNAGADVLRSPRRISNLIQSFHPSA